MKSKIRNFKITDPVIQSILIMVFIIFLLYSWPHKIIYFLLLAWQFVSVFVHMGFKRATMLKEQRTIFFGVAIGYVIVHIVVSLLVPEAHFEDNIASGHISIPIYSTVLTAIGLSISFWYYVICIREIRRILNKNYHLDF
jgi:hypothetical protein